MRDSFFLLLRRLAWLVCALNASVWAQNAPSTGQMIEQLKAPRTRSLRNLTVEPTPSNQAGTPTSPPADTAAPPPLSPPATPAATSPVQEDPRPSLSLLIQFDFNSAKVRAESQQALANLAAALKSPQLQDARFAVEGHTDAKGRTEYNLKLSQDRADAVRDYLLAQGIARERLRSEGKGASELANTSDPSAAENRRVRIINLD